MDVLSGEEFFFGAPPAPPSSQCWVCINSNSALRKYFSHWRHTPPPNIERRGARGAAAQVRFGKLNVIGVVCFAPLPVAPFLSSPPSQPFLSLRSLASLSNEERKAAGVTEGHSERVAEES